MKTLLVTSVCALTLSGAALGQGTVFWSAINFVSMTAETNTGTGIHGPTASATTGIVFNYALLYQAFNGYQAPSPSTVSALDTWQFSGLTATNSNVAGRLTAVAPNTAATVPWSAGVTSSIVMVGWSANLGSTWLTALNVLNNWSTLSGSIVGDAFFGASNTGYIAPADNVNPGAMVFGTAATPLGLPIYSPNTQLLYSLFTSDPLNMQAVPEPGTLTLAGLGGLALVALRRRPLG